MTNYLPNTQHIKKMVFAYSVFIFPVCHDEIIFYCGEARTLPNKIMANDVSLVKNECLSFISLKARNCEM